MKRKSEQANIDTTPGGVNVVFAFSLDRSVSNRAAVDATCIAPDGSAHTALHVASMRNMPGVADCLQALLDGGADLFYKTARGLSALHCAAGNGNIEGCKLLHAASCGRAPGIKGWLCSAGVTPLMMACNNSEFAAVQLLCELGADVNCCDDAGITALGFAALEGDARIVRYLLERDSSSVNVKDRRGDTALMAAALKGRYACVKLLLEHGADARYVSSKSGSAIGAAASNGHLSIVQLLRKHGSDIATVSELGRTLLMKACKGGYEELAEYLLREGASVHAVDTYNCTALHYAAACAGHSSTIKLLLQHGADVSACEGDNAAPLSYAVQCACRANTEALLAAGSDVLHSDCRGNTVLHLAVRDKQAAIVKLLLEHGAGAVVNTMQCKQWVDFDGVSALMMCNDAAILKLLLAAGADVHAVTSSGDTCLHIAARQRYAAPVLCLLIKAGADLHAVNSAGKSAAQVARDTGNLLTMLLLIRAAQQA
eukprot:7363-Heterococcus_DN1.PRE.2